MTYLNVFYPTTLLTGNRTIYEGKLFLAVTLNILATHQMRLSMSFEPRSKDSTVLNSSRLADFSRQMSDRLIETWTFVFVSQISRETRKKAKRYTLKMLIKNAAISFA